MKKKYLYTGWLALFILCAIVGSIPREAQTVSVWRVMLSLAFFVPGGILLYRALANKNRQEILLLRLISGLSLGLTLLLIILNFLSLSMPGWLGNFLYALLIIVSSPMVCGQYWVVSLFLWACMLVITLLYAPKR